MKLRCKPGDLAIVTGANYDCNLGLVVQVIEPAPIEHPLLAFERTQLVGEVEIPNVLHQG